MKKMTIIMKINNDQSAEGRQTLDPEKGHFNGEFVIVAKFGDHVLCHLASSLLTVVRQADKNSSLGRISIWHLVTI